MVNHENKMDENGGFQESKDYLHYWLVVDLPLWKIMDFVSWDDDTPNRWKIIKFMFQTTNQIIWSIFINPIKTMNFPKRCYVSSNPSSNPWPNPQLWPIPTHTGHPSPALYIPSYGVRTVCAVYGCFAAQRARNFVRTTSPTSRTGAKIVIVPGSPTATAPGDGVRIHTSHWFQKIWVIIQDPTRF